MGFFFVVAQAALVFTAAEYEGKDACFTDPTLPSCKNADDFCKFAVSQMRHQLFDADF